MGIDFWKTLFKNTRGVRHTYDLKVDTFLVRRFRGTDSRSILYVPNRDAIVSESPESGLRTLHKSSKRTISSLVFTLESQLFQVESNQIFLSQIGSNYRGRRGRGVQAGANNAVVPQVLPGSSEPWSEPTLRLRLLFSDALERAIARCFGRCFPCCGEQKMGPITVCCLLQAVSAGDW